jgi:predicted ATPase/DNA-binding CsgD family transcriptional regulator
MSRKLELGLTPRELQVARLVRDGLTDREIAEKLFITRRTAEWHLKQIFNKLGVNSRAQVAAWVAHDQAVGSTAESPVEHRSKLPLQLTTFVGRASELVAIERLLATQRLVTLIATGGAGKTRLALEVATRALDAFSDGAWFVDLTPVQDGHLVPGVFGSALGVHERPRQPMAHTLIEHLRSRRLLLVVDNCEHVIEDCATFVDTILRSCPGVTVLATSRESLRVSGETVWRLAPLAVPDPAAAIDLDELAGCEAVCLFLDRSQSSAPGFALSVENAGVVAELCRRLDGIPLAIELAAARVGLMSPDQILTRLQDRFGFLIGGVRAGPARHRTLRLAIDWSHDLLNDPERTLFRRLSVFAGGFSLEAVEQVCPGEDLEVTAIVALLDSLIDKSLVITANEWSPEVRFRLLDTLQQYGSERLEEAGEVDRLRERHCEFFSSLALEASPNLRGLEMQAWHRRLADDVSNLRAALAWSRGRDTAAHLRLASALMDFWYIDGLVQEGDTWFEGALDAYPARDQLRALALRCGAQISFWRADLERYALRCGESLAIYREIGDRQGIRTGLSSVGVVFEWRGDDAQASRYYNDALAASRQAADTESMEVALRNLGRVAIREGDHSRARSFLEQSLALNDSSGNQLRRNWALMYMGLNAAVSGDFRAAGAYLEEALNIGVELDWKIGVATPLMYFAVLAAARMDPIRALRLSGAAEALAESAGAAPIRLTRPIVEQWLDRSRKELGPERSATSLIEGRAMSWEAAIDYALNG